MNTNKGFKAVKDAASSFVADDAMTLGAALAFYTALSLAPLLGLLLTFAGYMGESTKEQFVQQVSKMVGPNARDGLEMIIENAQEQKDAGSLTALLSTIMLAVSGTFLFVQLQVSLNRIWNVEAKPGGAVWGWVRKRLLSLLVILLVACLFLFAMGLTAVLTSMNLSKGVLWQVIEAVISLLVFTGVFALVYKLLPDVTITWRDTAIGAIITAVLFYIGKFAIARYLGYSSVGSVYGAAGSAVLLLVWVYYSSLVLFFGAELTQAYARYYGTRLVPDKHAQWIDPEEAREYELSRPKEEPA